ncbi:MAG: CvpA family protein [Ruminococcaceae bacterium]|nr:CvpA family protein [Oscillospiraceae bacterium]
MQYIIMIAAVLILVINILVGLLRGLNKGLLRLGFVILAAVASFFLAKGLSGALGENLVAVLQEAVASNPDMTAFLQNNAEVISTVGVISQMLIGPVLFLLCYVILKPLTWIIFLILSKLIKIKNPKNAVARMLGGAGIGFVIGIVGLLVFVTPVMGYTQLFSRTITEADALTARMGDMDLEEYNEQYLAPAAKAPVAAQVYNMLGDSLFSGLSSAKWNGEKVRLENEWFAVVGTANDGIRLAEKPVAEYGESESQSIHEMVANVDRSVLLSGLASHAISSFADAWLEGDLFMGIAKPTVGEESIEIIFDGLLEVLALTDADQFAKDLEFFADLIDLLIEHQVLAQIGTTEDTQDLIAYLVSSGFLPEAKALIGANPRMNAVNDAISNAAMRLLVRQLGDPAEYLETHGELMNDVSNVLKEAVDAEGKINTDTLTQNMSEALSAHQIELPAEATQLLATSLAEEFTAEELADPNLTVETITNRLIDRLSGLPNIDQYISSVPAA